MRRPSGREPVWKMDLVVPLALALVVLGAHFLLPPGPHASADYPNLPRHGTAVTR